MTVEELKRILNVLKENKREGVGIYTLSKKTDIGAYELRGYLSKHKDYFVFLRNEQLFTINRFGRFKGSIPKMVNHYEKKLKQQASSPFLLYFLMFVAIMSSITTMIATNN